MNTKTPAILGGRPVRSLDSSETIPHRAPCGDREVQLATEVIRSGSWSGGPAHKRARDLLREITGAEHVTILTNGTHALYNANAALGVGAWIWVWSPGLTWAATSGNVLTLGGVPELFDVERETLTLDVELVRAELEFRLAVGAPLPRIIWLVALYHRLPNLKAFRELVGEFSERAGQRIYLGLDHAHGPGGRYMGRPLLDWVDIITGSAQESKNAKAGEAGWIATNDPQVAEQLESRISCGRPPAGRAEGWQSDQFRLAATVAAPWCGQLERYRDEWLPRLQQSAEALDRIAAELDGVEPLGPQPGAESQVYKWAFRQSVLPAFLYWRALEAEIGYEVRGPYPALTRRDHRNPYYPDTAPTAGFSEEYRRLITTLPRLPVAEAAIDEVAAVEWMFGLEGDLAAEIFAEAHTCIAAHAGEIQRAYASDGLRYWFEW